MYIIFRDEPSENQKKGIDMILKSLHKKYPFIIGWEFTDNNPNKYSTMVGIDVIADADKVSEYYEKPLISTFNDYEFMRRGYSFCSPLNNLSMSNFDDLPCYKDYTNLKKTINKLHKYLPQQYKFHTRMKNENDEIVDYIGAVDIDLNSIKFVRTND